jgi:hypothetical protein
MASVPGAEPNARMGSRGAVTVLAAGRIRRFRLRTTRSLPAASHTLVTVSFPGNVSGDW